MKKLFMKGTALFLFAGFASCTNDEIIEQNQSDYFSVEATMGLVESRTCPEAYEENGKTKYHTNWHSKDAIYVFGERVKGTLALQEGAGSTNGKFYGRIYGDSRNLAYSAYPAEFIVTNSAGEVTGFEFNEIDYKEGNTMAPMFGEFITSKKVDFQHLVGMLKVEINNIPENSTLEVFGAGICGKAGLVVNSDGKYSLVPEEKTATKTIKIKNIPSGNQTLFVPIYIASPDAEGINAKHIGLKLNGNTFKYSNGSYPYVNTMVGQVTAKNMPKLVWNETAAAGESKLQELKTWDGSSEGEKIIPDETTGEYDIDSTEKLLWFATQVNAGISFKGKTVNLVTNIDLNNMPWTPIGTSSNPFNGTFDGQNHIISNLAINGGSKNNIGLFGVTQEGEIKNLTVNNAEVSGRLNVAVVAGTPYTSKYTNITVTGHVEINGMSYVGTVGGKNAYANWNNITVNVDETSYVNANSVEDKAYRTYVGGVVGFNGEGSHSFKNITSNIDVKGSTCDVGGLFGIAHYGNQFENCVCTGDVEVYDASEAANAEEVGGIAGVWHNQTGYTVTFTNCSFTGDITTNIERGTVWYDNLVGKPYISTGTGKLIIDGECFTFVNSSENLATALAETSIETITLAAGKYENIDFYNIAERKTLTIVGTKGTKLSFDNLQVRACLFDELKIENCEILRMPNKNWGMLVFGSSSKANGVYTLKNCTFNGEGTQGIYINENASGATYNIEDCIFNGNFGNEGAITIQNNTNVDHIVNVTGCTFNNTPENHKIFIIGNYEGWTLNTDNQSNVYWGHTNPNI